MKISVAICTWNRASLLGKTLESLANVEKSREFEWELLVINNNCTDHTDEVIAQFCDRLPLRRILEDHPGLSYARNRALCEATGEFIVFVDDDVLVGPDWLTGYAHAFIQHPGTAIFVGPIEPWFESEPPRWFARHLSELSGITVSVDHGVTPRELALGEAIFGANLGLRREVALRTPFNTNLGRVKTNLIGGEDSDFCARIMGNGGRAMWVPNVRVRHFVPNGRLTREYVDRWHIDSGRLVVRQWASVPGPLLAGAPRWALRKLLLERAKAVLWSPLKNDRWFQSHRQALMLQGIVLESRALNRF